MRISIFGLGYVGTVAAACLARDGHDIVGVDTAAPKVELINSGRSPIIEEHIGEIIAETVKTGRLRATTDHEQAILETELSFVCVGTPSLSNGHLDLSSIRRVCEQIGSGLKNKPTRHAVVIRSTILPGTLRNILVPILEEASEKKAGTDFGVCHNPEFLREGSSVMDFDTPPMTVIGEYDGATADVLAGVYANLSAPFIRTTPETSEMIKYVSNCWHALKIGFANEVGNLCKALSVDGREVMQVFCQDKKLNLSSTYLIPGFAFGGSCLPKDLRALTYAAKLRDVELPILKSILPSNDLQVSRALNMITQNGHKRIGVFGFSFKAGTDDLRESPMIEIIERLIGKGYDLRVYDKNVQLASLVGANRDFILNRIPHISRLMVSRFETVLDHAETIVIGNNDPAFHRLNERLHNGQRIVDLVGITAGRSNNGKYDGICW